MLHVSTVAQNRPGEDCSLFSRPPLVLLCIMREKVRRLVFSWLQSARVRQMPLNPAHLIWDSETYNFMMIIIKQYHGIGPLLLATQSAAPLCAINQCRFYTYTGGQLHIWWCRHYFKIYQIIVGSNISSAEMIEEESMRAPAKFTQHITMGQCFLLVVVLLFIQGAPNIWCFWKMFFYPSPVLCATFYRGESTQLK